MLTNLDLDRFWVRAQNLPETTLIYKKEFTHICRYWSVTICLVKSISSNLTINRLFHHLFIWILPTKIKNGATDDLTNPSHRYAIEISESDIVSIECSEGASKKQKKVNVTLTEFTRNTNRFIQFRTPLNTCTKKCRYFNLIQYNYTEIES